MPTGSKYATGDRAWGLCQKCGLRFLLRTLVFDGYYPNLRVCSGCYDSRQPQEFLVDVTDPTALWKPSPEWGPENPQLSAVAFAGEVDLSWTECIPRGGSRVADYLLYRSLSTDGVNFTASIQIADLPVVYYTDLADLVENGDPKFDNEGIKLEFLSFVDTSVPAHINYAKYQVFAKLASKRLANSNVVTVPIIAASAVESIASAAIFLSASLAAFLPPTGNSVESIDSGADFIAGSFISVDPDFIDVSLLLHMDGTNGSTGFPDSSMNNFFVTAHGTAAVTTTNPEFGTGCGSFDGSSGFLSVPNAANGPLDLSAGDFTIEFWVFPNASQPSGEGIIFCTSDFTIAIFQNSGGGGAITGDLWGHAIVSVGGNCPPGQWNAVAIVMQANEFTVYINGVATTAPTSVIRTGITAGTIDIANNSGFFYRGNIDELRITNGVARYTSNYTPSGPFPNS